MPGLIFRELHLEQTALGFFQTASEYVWGIPMLILLVGTGIFLTILLRGLQFRGLFYSLYLALIKRKEEGAYEGDITHFITLTFWDSLESIKGFAGEDVEVAKYYPEDKDFLLEFEPNVVHYEVVGQSL